MAQVTSRPLTKYDYWVLPEAGPRYQLINGNLFMAPPSNRFHQDISRTIQFEMMKYLEVQPVGIVYDADLRRIAHRHSRASSIRLGGPDRIARR
jgi:hypothetical protein